MADHSIFIIFEYKFIFFEEKEKLPYFDDVILLMTSSNVPKNGNGHIL